MIDRRRWPEVDGLLERLLDLPAGERDAALAAECGDDEELRRAVEALLAGEAEPDPFASGAFSPDGGLEPWLAELGSEPDETPPPLEGQAIGPYTLGPELGRGGMAVVHAAERTDGEFDPKVAIKLLAWGDRSGEIGARFRRERRILAALDHPNVTRLLDGGVSPDGRPYFVMERVDGEPIDAYCRRRRLPLRPRLELWLAVADAVAYAHRRLLVHRDLKPSNILVTAAGQVKLLDFGIAKVLPEEGRMAPELTRLGRRPMTPRYSSPEQVSEREITTATDVYQLGVLLHELIAGRPPYEVEGGAAADWEEAIRHQDPIAPSRTLRRAPTASGGPGSTGDGGAPVPIDPRELTGDLDAIVLRALAKRPEDRYESARAMREDVERHLAGLPVRARPSTPLYRLGRFVRRHRGAVAALLVAVISLVALIGYHGWRLASEKERAVLAAHKAEAVTAFLTELFRGGNPEVSGRDDLLARDLLDRGAARIDDELADQPEVRSEVQSVIGRAYLALGRYDEAEALQQEALATVREHSGERSEDAAEILSRLGVLHLELGRFERADGLLREALAIRRELPEVGVLDIAGTLNNLGLASLGLGRLDEAREYFEEAIELKERVVDPGDKSLGNSLANLATVLFRQKELERSIAVSRRAVAILEAHDEPALASALTNLANALRRTGEHEEARRQIERAIEIKERAYGAGHPRVASSLDILGGVLTALGDRAGARRAYERAVAIYREGYGPDHPRVATPLTNLAIWHLEGGDAAAASGLFREALRIRVASLGPAHPRVSQTRVRLAMALAAAGDAEAAEEELRLALPRLREQAESGDFLSEALLLLGEILDESGRAAAAEALLTESLEIRIADLGRDDPETGRVLLALGRCRQRTGRGDEALALFDEVAERFEDEAPELAAQAVSAAGPLR